MKNFIILILSFALALNSNAQHTPHYKEYYPGGYWITNANLQPGDTMHLNKGVYTYISGDGLNNVTFLPADEGIQMTSGFNFTNSSNIHIAGYDSLTGKHRIYIHDASGVAIQAHKRCSNWIIDGVDMYKVYSFGWFKTDPNEFTFPDGSIDTSQLKYVMDGLIIKHCICKTALFDGWYIGNTDPQGRRTYLVGGKWIGLIPNPVAHIYIEDVTCDSAYRTLMQVSGLKDSLIVKDSKFLNAGINSYLDADGRHQGSDLVIGGANNLIYASITNSVFKNANLTNFWSQAGGKIIFHNNITDSAGAVFRIGQGYAIGTEVMASVQLDNPVESYLDIQNNSFGWSINKVGLVLYGKVISGSKYANNKFTGIMQNPTGALLDTTSSTKPPVDTVTQPPVDTVVNQPAADSITNLEYINKTLTVSKASGSLTTFNNVAHYEVDNKGKIRLVFADKRPRIIIGYKQNGQ